MKGNKQKRLYYYMSLGGTMLFALLTVLIMFAPFLLLRPWSMIGNASATGLDFIDGI